MIKQQTGLSLRAAGWGFPLANKSMTAGTFMGNKRTIKPKNVPAVQLPAY